MARLAMENILELHSLLIIFAQKQKKSCQHIKFEIKICCCLFHKWQTTGSSASFRVENLRILTKVCIFAMLHLAVVSSKDYHRHCDYIWKRRLLNALFEAYLNFATSIHRQEQGNSRCLCLDMYHRASS